MATTFPALPAPLLSAGFTNGDLGEGFLLMVIGMGTVFGALIVLMGVLVLLDRIVGREAAPAAITPAPAPAAPASVPVVAATNEDALDPETLAVLTAAVMAVVRVPVRLKSVKFISHEGGKDWASHGRAAIHTSHRLRKG